MNTNRVILVICLILCSRISAPAQDLSRYYDNQFNCKELKNVSGSGNIKPDSLSSCTVYTQVDFGNMDFQKSAVFNQCIFNTAVNFLNTQFHDESDFSKTYFLGITDFSEAVFHDNPVFYWCIFYQDVVFQQVQFDSTSVFVSSLLKENANFDRIKAGDAVNFLGIFSNGSFSMKNAEVAAKVYFTEATLNKGADFSHSKFNGGIHLNKSKINGEIIFNDVDLGQTADFSSAQIAAPLNFTNAEMPDTIYFSYTTDIALEVDLTTGKYDNGSSVLIDLTGSAMDMIKLDYSHFKLFFRTDDQDLIADNGVRMMVYRKLLENQEKNGFTKGYEKLDKEYQAFNYMVNGQHFKNWFQKYWLDYGYNTTFLLFRNLLIVAGLVFLIIYLTRKKTAKRRLAGT